MAAYFSPNNAGKGIVTTSRPTNEPGRQINELPVSRVATPIQSTPSAPSPGGGYDTSTQLGILADIFSKQFGANSPNPQTVTRYVAPASTTSSSGILPIILILGLAGAAVYYFYMR
jgi:hypothetical protein